MCGVVLVIMVRSLSASGPDSGDLAKFVHLDIESTVLQVERDGALRQVLELNVSFQADGCAGGEAVARRDRTPGDNTCIMGNSAFENDTQIAGWEVFCTGPGPIQLRIFRREGLSMIQVAQSPTEQMEHGFNRFILAAPIPVKKGDLVGFYVAKGASVAEDPEGGDFYYRSGDVTETRSNVSIWSRSKVISSVQTFDEKAKSRLDNFYSALPQADVTTRCGTETRTVRWDRLESDRGARFLDIPSLEKTTPVTITLKSDQFELSREIRVEPEKKWKIYLLHSLHVDIGYTEFDPVVAGKLAQNLDTLLDFYEVESSWLADLQPVWNEESAWVIDEYRRRRSPEQFKRLILNIKNGRISVQALYANSLSGLYTPEGLIRLLYFTAELKRDYGIPILSAKQTDTPNYTYALPSILAGAGIRYLAVGRNTCVPGRRPKVNPCYWVGPDGSEVLLWHSPTYKECLHVDGSDWRPIQNRIRLAQRESSICDAVGLYGLYIDNTIIETKDYWARLDLIKAWNQRWAYPKLIMGTPYDLLHYIEDKFGNELPRLRGDWGSDWEDGAASSALETGINRRAKNVLAAAETLATVASSIREDYRYPKKQIDEVYRNVMLYDEHVWGAWEGIDKPESETTNREWAIKSAYATDALHSAQSVAESALNALVSEVTTGQGIPILVYNPLSWPRTAVASINMSASGGLTGDSPEVIDPVTGKPVPSQREGKNGELIFLARDLPSVGYKTFYLKKAGLQEDSSIRIDGAMIENRFFKVTLDPNSGAVASIFDKELRRELVDSKSPYRFNQYLYDNVGVRDMAWRRRGKEDGSREGQKGASIRPGTNGPVRGSIISTATGPMAPRLEQEIILYGDLKRIDFVNRMQKELTYDIEQVYYAFPFAVGKPDFICELGGSIISAVTDRFDCADRNWFAIQNWVDVSNDQYGITWSSQEAPIVSFVEISNEWVEKLVPANGSLFSYIMNNVWSTNYKAGQGGNFTFHYTITSHQGGTDRVRATRFGAELASPVLCRTVPSNQSGLLPKDQYSFCQLNTDGVVLQCLKRAEDGQGIIARVREIRGRDTTVRLELPRFSFRQAARTNLVEEDIEPIKLDGTTVTLTVKGGGMATARCW